MKCETARERGGRMMREGGYKMAESHGDKAADEDRVRSAMKQHDSQLHSKDGSHVGHTKLKLRRGGKVHGKEAAERVDRRARGGKVHGKGKTIINVNAGGEGQNPQQAQMAHQQGLQQGMQLGARAAAAKLAGGAPGGPPGGGAPMPPRPMMPPGGMPPPGGGGMPPPGMGPPGGMPPRPMPPPGAGPMARGGKVVRRDMHGRFLGGAL